MAREKVPPPDTTGEIPSWFMTYSDVITLLMTFFILLLTFSTTEPERFEKIQVAMFGGAGSTGIAGDPPDGIERDSWVVRTRPPSARISMDGSEMPPMQKNPEKQTADGNLSGLDENKFDNLSDQYAVNLKIRDLVSSQGEVFALGQQQAKMFAKQMFRLPMHVTFEAGSQDSVNRAVALAHYIFRDLGIKPGQMGVRLVEGVPEDTVRAVIEHHLAK